MENKLVKNAIVLILSFAVWGLIFLEYFNTNCIKWPRAGVVCGNDAIIILIVAFFICMSVPITYFYKPKKRVDTDKKF